MISVVLRGIWGALRRVIDRVVADIGHVPFFISNSGTTYPTTKVGPNPTGGKCSSSGREFYFSISKEARAMQAGVSPRGCGGGLLRREGG